MKTLHALLFAINDYPKPDHRLRGCINDQQAIHAYLQAFCSRVGYTYRPLLRTDGEVTRQGFIQAFQHFSAAKDGDVAVLFYGGHGSRVPAPQAFWEIVPDRVLETGVCHDSRL